jgi:XTP/dITP diphosphohydrolase
VKPLFQLCLATTNRGKLAELRSLLADLPIELLSLSAVLPGQPQAVEDGVTFLDNARIKARAAAAAGMMVTLAEDAGLEVDALGGRPGVRSARFAGEKATDAENNAALLEALDEVEDDQRAARFRCVMVLIDPWGEGESREIVAEGRCEGSVTRQPSGGGGFGYDPLFVVAGLDGGDPQAPRLGRTMAELGEDEKNRLSHRAQAVAALRPALLDLIARRRAAADHIGGI